ncbi:hypothetical protein MILUP08_41744 [Micromonospora lupini str. Lupac 08]|uniref:Uncharacterized protein n=1 Tax=Micromonospora lupini str. Lupac 08 TaxID=1150864 RepID=I0KZ30_9ACTN|nr:hypothetical protein MILUP08_41744 [Micromonospora lupini str. Lupac 08]
MLGGDALDRSPCVVRAPAQWNAGAEDDRLADVAAAGRVLGGGVRAWAFLPPPWFAAPHLGQLYTGEVATRGPGPYSAPKRPMGGEVVVRARCGVDAADESPLPIR